MEYMKHVKLAALLLITGFLTSCGQAQTSGAQAETFTFNPLTTTLSGLQGPKAITRNIIEDQKGNIWMAAFDGIYRYDGKSFTQMTSKVTASRFFSVLEDRKGQLWFGTVGADGSGLYCYDGKSFKNFTTKDGLLNNEVGCMYEDTKGKIWFGVSGGASCYDGKTFQNFIIEENEMVEDKTGKTFSDRRPYEVNSIIQDKTGKFWFASRGNMFVYDGKTFTAVSHEDKPFKNVRTLMKDNKGSIWLAGSDGLWRYSNGSLTNFTRQFVGYVFEDKKGNIWTSAERVGKQGWALSMYEGKTLLDKKPMIKEVAKKEMIFGILEDRKGNIWFGDLEGVHRYDGKTVTDFKSEK